MNKITLFALFISLSSFSKVRPDSVVKSYPEFTPQSFEVFAEVASVKWIQQVNNIVMLEFGELGDNGEILTVYEERDWILRKELNFLLKESSKKNKFLFEMIGGTWNGSNGGGGYAVPIPVKRMGHKQISESVHEFMIWGRLEYSKYEDDKKMDTDVIHPLVYEAREYYEVGKLLNEDEYCLNLMAKNEYIKPIDCAIKSDVTFDYMVLRYSTETPTEIEVIGRMMNQKEDKFSFKMKAQ